MQNRYVADFGDYVKLSILRALIGEPQRTRLGIAWWLFPDEYHNKDGSHREYLKRPDEWKRFDPDLFESLVSIDREGRRDVRALEDARLLPGAIFAPDRQIPCDLRPFAHRPLERQRWLAKIKGQLGDCELVFLDPDNGIAQEGLRLTRRRAGKSVTVDEIKELAQNRTTIVYHHQTRRAGGHISEIYTLAERLRDHGLRVTGALRAKPWSPRVFFILDGNAEIQGRAERIPELWENNISWHPDAELLRNSNQPICENPRGLNCAPVV